MGELKSLRIDRKLTQNQAADILGVSLRSYKSYENDEKKSDFMLLPDHHCFHIHRMRKQDQHRNAKQYRQSFYRQFKQ